MRARATGASGVAGRRRPDHYRVVLAAGTAAVAYFTLFPFDFGPRGRSLRSILSDARIDAAGSTVYTDVPLNVALFVVFGVGVAGLVRERHSRRVAVGLALLASGLASVLVELVQGYALLRDPALSDVLANAAGGLIGALLVAVGGASLDRGVYRARSSLAGVGLRTLGLFCLAYFVVVASASLVAGSSTRFEEWDLGQTMSLGNESTGDRPWEGRVRTVAMVDHRLDADEFEGVLSGRVESDATVVLRHDFTSLTEGFPVLEWSTGAGVQPDGVAVDVGSRRWLRTPAPVAELSAALLESSEFTLALEVATDDPDQDGPARILAVSDGPHRRNLTIAQSGSGLVVRLRTGLTDRNGVPETRFDDVFVDNAFHRIVVSYENDRLEVRLDDRSTSEMRIAPGAAILFRYFPHDIQTLRPSRISEVLVFVAHRAIVFGPWAAALGVSIRRRSTRRRVFGAFVAVVVPVLVLEFVFAAGIAGYRIGVGRVLLGVAVSVVALALFSRRSSMPSQRAYDPRG